MEEFGAWVKKTDPLGVLTHQQQAELFIGKHESQNGDIEMGLVATKNSANELNALIHLTKYSC